MYVSGSSMSADFTHLVLFILLLQFIQALRIFARTAPAGDLAPAPAPAAAARFEFAPVDKAPRAGAAAPVAPGGAAYYAAYAPSANPAMPPAGVDAKYAPYGRAVVAM